MRLQDKQKYLRAFGIGNLISSVASNISRLHPYQNEYGGGYDQAWDTFAYNPATCNSISNFKSFQT